jgi:Tol biopolymer transport system component
MTRLTFERSVDSDPTWSPDGTRLIYASARAGDKSLYEISASGGSPRLVLKSPEGQQLSMDAWSPDGRTILYHSDTEANRRIWALPLESDPKPLLVYEPGAGTVSQPSFSPDGKWVAFSSNESGTDHIYVVPFPPTGAKWQVSVNAGAQPMWRRDGRELYFLSSGSGQIMAADVRLGTAFEAGPPRALFVTNIVPQSGNSQYVVTGDGQRFIAMVPVAANIQAIVDWPGLLKRP